MHLCRSLRQYVHTVLFQGSFLDLAASDAFEIHFFLLNADFSFEHICKCMRVRGGGGRVMAAEVECENNGQNWYCFSSWFVIH